MAKSQKTFDKSKKICHNRSRRFLPGFKQLWSIKMNFLKKAAAAALSAVMLAGMTLPAYAEADGTALIKTGDGSTMLVVDFGNETSVIDPATGDSSGDPGTSGAEIVTPGGSTETTIIDPDETISGKPDSVLDVSNHIYSETDTSGWTEWDGKTKMQSGVNYYISKDTKLRGNFGVPAGSRLLIKSGARLVVYTERSLNVRGILTIEPGAELMTSGTLTVFESAGLENFGSFKASVSALVRIAGDFINRSTGSMIASTSLNVYKNGTLLNYGELSLTTSADMVVTGDFQTSETGRLLCHGSLSVTINGRTTQAGYFSLTGSVVNSGVFVFEKTVRYYKSKAARFAVSKSSRLIDYRYSNGTFVNPDPGDDDNTSEDTTDSGIKGIDVSYAQGAIDWQKVKASGVEFAMLRASRGPVSSTRPASEDTTFKRNITEAAEAGIKVGVYHYLYAHTVSEAKQEAKFFIKTISPYQITYPVVLDVEEQSQANLGKSALTKIVKAFLDEVNAAGYYGMLYSNKSWLTTYLDMSKLTGYEVWLAQWNTVPTYTGDFGMWQYTCKGIVSGIDGYVDLNLSYKNYAKIIKKGGYNHLT